MLVSRFWDWMLHLQSAIHNLQTRASPQQTCLRQGRHARCSLCQPDAPHNSGLEHQDDKDNIKHAYPGEDISVEATCLCRGECLLCTPAYLLQHDDMRSCRWRLTAGSAGDIGSVPMDHSDVVWSPGGLVGASSLAAPALVLATGSPGGRPSSIYAGKGSLSS